MAVIQSKVTQVSNINKFLQQLGLKTKVALNGMGKEGIASIKSKTPVDTGDLRDATFYNIIRTRLWFINPLYYAPFVELGTYKQYAQPFMKTGIRAAYPAFTKVLTKELRV